MNSLPSHPAVRGLQTFYDGEEGKQFARAIQDRFNSSGLNINRRPAAGNYFILECTAYPSVLVEGGFLSNPAEEKLLQSAKYQKILAQYMSEAIIYTGGQSNTTDV
jgi:N-acetylmuramoyl-L-alanine amidase